MVGSELPLWVSFSQVGGKLCKGMSQGRDLSITFISSLFISFPIPRENLRYLKDYMKNNKRLH